MAGGKRKVAQGKTMLEAKRTKIEEDIDDFLKDLTGRNHVNTNSDATKDVDTNKAEIIEFTIKESVCEDFTAIQVAVNNAFDLKNKELKKLIDEKNNLVKALGEAEKLWDKYDADINQKDAALEQKDIDLKQKDEQIRTLQELLKNAKDKFGDKELKATQVTINKLTANVDTLLKQNRGLAKENRELKEENITKETGIQKCRNDFKIFEQKINKFRDSKKQQEIKEEIQAKEIDEKNKQLRELENQRLDDVKILQDKVKSVKMENKKLEKVSKDIFRDTKEKHKGEMQTKDEALQIMQKLIDAEKKLSNTLKRELKQKDEKCNHEISLKTEIESTNLELSQKVVENEKIIKRLEEENNEVKKKSYERKIKLKCAQQSYKTSLNDFIQKYEKNIEKMKAKLEKEKLKKKTKKKSIHVKSLKLILGVNSSKQSLTKDLEDNIIVKQFDKHRLAPEPITNVEHEQPIIDNGLASKQQSVCDSTLDFSDQDVPSTSQNHLQPSIERNESQEKEMEPPQEMMQTPPKRSEFSSFILWDESAFSNRKEQDDVTERGVKEKDNILIGFDMDRGKILEQIKENNDEGKESEQESLLESDNEEEIDRQCVANIEEMNIEDVESTLQERQEDGNLPKETQNLMNKVHIPNHEEIATDNEEHGQEAKTRVEGNDEQPEGLDDTRSLLNSENDEEIDREYTDNLDEINDYYLLKTNKHATVVEIHTNASEDEQECFENDCEKTTKSEDDIIEEIIELLITNVVRSKTESSTPSGSDFELLLHPSTTELLEMESNMVEEIGQEVTLDEIVNNEGDEDIIAKNEHLISDNTDSENSRWFDRTKEKILNNINATTENVETAGGHELSDFNVRVTENVKKCLLNYYNNPEAVLGQYKIKERQQFIDLCKKFSYQFRDEIKESFMTFNGSFVGITLTPDNKRFIKDQIEMCLENLQMAKRARKL